MRSDGQTLLSPEEPSDLIPNLATKEELNEWERENILLGRSWAFSDRTSAREMASDIYVRKLHRKMFDQTWKWAGEYRTTEKNLGIAVHGIRDALAVLLGDARYWMDHATYASDEIALRWHHRLLVIHPFPNGNGRHARLLADVLATRLGRPVFSWGARELARPGEARARYLEAIRAADGGDFRLLLEFGRL